MSKTIRYMLFTLWLTVTSIVLLTPAGHMSKSNVSTEGIDWLRRSLSHAVVWAAKDGDLWHVTSFFVLSAFAAMLPSVTASLKSTVILLVLITLYSLGTELIQEMIIPGRAFEWSDIGWNAVGSIFGVTLVVMWRRRADTRIVV